MKMSNKLVVAILLLISSFLCSSSKAQVIVEGFEEAAWPTTNTSAQAAGTITINPYNTTNSSNVATSNTGAWIFSNAYFVTNNTGTLATSTATTAAPLTTATTVVSSKTYSVNSGTYAFHLTASNSSYIVTPIMGAGISSVTIWARGNSTTANFAVYVASNTSLTTAAANLSNSGIVGNNWTTNGSSAYVANSNSGYASYVYSLTAGSASLNQNFIKIQRNGTGEISIDDITVNYFNAPTVSSSAATSVSVSGATLNGLVNANSNSTTASFDYGTSISYGTNTASSPSSITGTSNTAITLALTGLGSNTLYNFRAKGVNALGTTNSSNLTFTTLSNAPTVGTASSVTASAFTANWTAPSNTGSASITYTVDYSTDNTFSTGVTSISAISSSSQVVSALAAGTYYYRVKAVNAGGSSTYSATSSSISIAGASGPATVSTTAANSITSSSAVLGGNIASNGGNAVTDYGVVYSQTSNPPTTADNIYQLGTSDFSGAYSGTLSGLSPATTYYIAAYATNSNGTSYGTGTSFSTPASTPTVTTTALSSITLNTAASGGIVTATGGASITAQGVCWNTGGTPTIADSKTTDGTTSPFTSSITGLLPNTTYKIRAYATNSVGTSYGNEITLTTGSNSYYFVPTGSPNLASAAQWNSLSDGSGTALSTYTAGFNSNGVTYYINTTTTTTAAWSVSGTGSKIVVGNGTTASGITLNIASGLAITTTSPVVMDINAGGIVNVQDATTQPTFGTLNATSEVHYQATISALTLNNTVFGKVFFEQTPLNAATTITLNAGTPQVNTSLTVGTNASLKLSSGSTSWIVMNTGATATINGSITITKSAGFASFNVSTPGSSFGTLQFKSVETPGTSLVLNNGSTVLFSRTNNSQNQIIDARTDYKNVSITDAVSAFPKQFASGAVTITGNLTINILTSGSNTVTANGGLTLNGALILTSGTLDMSTYQLLGTISSVTGTTGVLKTSNTSSSPIPSGLTFGSGTTVNYAGSNQSIVANNYNNLDLTGASNINFPTGTVGIAGTFTPATISAASQGTINFNFATGGQTIPAFNYYNLKSTNISTGSNNSTASSGTITITNSFIQSGKTGLTNGGSSFTYAAGATYEFNGTSSLVLTSTNPEWPAVNSPTNITVNGQSSAGLSFTSSATSYSISTVALTSNVATITTSTSHTINVGDQITVGALSSNATFMFNGTYTVTAVTSNTISYSLTRADIAPTANSSSAKVALSNISRTITGNFTISANTFSIGAGNSLVLANGATTIMKSTSSAFSNGGGYVGLGTSSSDIVNARIDIGTGNSISNGGELNGVPAPGTYGTLTIVSGTYQLTSSRTVSSLVNNGVLSLAGLSNTGSFTIGSTSLSGSGSVSGSGTITGSSVGASLVLNGNNASASSLSFTSGSSTLGSLTVNRTNSSSAITINSDLSLSSNLVLSAGALNDGGYTITVAGNISGTGTHTGTGSVKMTGNAATVSGATLGNVEIVTTGTVTASAAVTINGNLQLSSGIIADGGFAISVAGNITGTGSHSSSTGGYLSMTGTSKTISSITVGNFNVTSGATVGNGTNTLTVNGNISGAGTFTSSTGKVIMTGNIASTTIGDITITNLELDNTSFNFSLSSSMVVSGSITLTNGSFTLSSPKTLTMLNGSTIVRGNGSFGGANASLVFGTSPTDLINVTIKSTCSNSTEMQSAASPGKVGTLTVNNGATYTFTGGRTVVDVVNNGIISLAPVTTFTFVVNGNISGSGTISGHNSAAITINGANPGTLNFTAGSRNASTLTINSSGSLTLGTPLVLSAGLALTAGTLSAGSNDVTVNTSLSGSGTFSSTTGKIIMIGSAIPSITSVTVSNLELNNANGFVLSGSGTILTITGNLNFVAGKLTTNSTLRLVKLTNGASITNADASTGWVVGNLEKYITSAGVNTYEIGDASNYLPVNINIAASGFNTGSLQVTSITSFVTQSGSLSLSTTTTKLNRYWIVQTPVGSTFAGNYTGIFNYASADLTGVDSDLQSAIYNGTNWSYPGAPTLSTLQLSNPSAVSASTVNTFEFAGKRGLTISGVIADKVYDGTTNASLDFSGSSLVGINNSNNVTINYTGATGSFSSRNIGLNQTVTVTGVTLSGTDVNAYTLSNQPVVLANITALPLTVTATTNSKLYDGNTSAAAIPTTSIDVTTLGDVAGFTEAYSTITAGVGNKILIPTGYVIDGNNGDNYSYTFVNSTNGSISYSLYTWIGSASNDWFNSSNWSGGAVPSSSVQITIPTGLTTYPVLNAPYTAKDINNESGATIGLGTGNLTITGAISGAGLLVGSSTGTLTMNSSSANTLNFRTTGSSDTLVGTLTLNGSGMVTLGTGVGITSLLSLNNSSSILNLNNNHLTLKSTSLANTAEVGAVAHGAFITGGNVTVERYIPKEFRNYRDLGASVANAGSVFANWQESGAAGNNVNNGFFITGTAAKFSPYIPGKIFEPISGLDYTTTGNPSMYTYTGTTWPAVTSTKALSLNPFQGYRAIVRGARNFNMGTNPNTMPTATTVRATGKLITGDVTITTAGTTVTDNSAYNSSFALTSGSSAYSLIANPYACPVQWSKILGHSSIYNTYWYLDPTYQDPSGNQRYITVQYSGGVTIVTPNPNGGSSADASFDYIQSGQAIMVNNYGNGTPSISFREADKTTGATNNDVFKQTTPSLMSIELYKNSSLADATVANFNNNFTKAIGTEDASKMMNSAENISITESNNDLSIDGLPTPSVNDVLPVRLGQLKANTTYQLKADISKFNTAGLQAYVRDNMLNTEVAAGNMISFTPTSVDVQSYKDRFSIVFKQSKVVVPVVIVKGNISVFPNPVTAKSFKVQTSNIAAGKYNVVMVNSFGQEVMSTPITHVEGSNTETIKMSKALTSGVYTLVLKSAEGKTVYQTELLAK